MSTHGRMGGEDEDSFALNASGSDIVPGSGAAGAGAGVGGRGVRFGDQPPEGAGRGFGRGGGKGGKGKGRKMAWNRFKWALFVANTVVRFYLPSFIPQKYERA